MNFWLNICVHFTRSQGGEREKEKWHDHDQAFNLEKCYLNSNSPGVIFIIFLTLIHLKIFLDPMLFKHSIVRLQNFHKNSLATLYSKYFSPAT